MSKISNQPSPYFFDLSRANQNRSLPGARSLVRHLTMNMGFLKMSCLFHFLPIPSFFLSLFSLFFKAPLPQNYVWRLTFWQNSASESLVCRYNFWKFEQHHAIFLAVQHYLKILLLELYADDLLTRLGKQHVFTVEDFLWMGYLLFFRISAIFWGSVGSIKAAVGTIKYNNCTTYNRTI